MSLTHEERLLLVLLSEATGAWCITAGLLDVHTSTLDRIVRGSRVHAASIRRVRAGLARHKTIHVHGTVQ